MKFRRKLKNALRDKRLEIDLIASLFLLLLLSISASSAHALDLEGYRGRVVLLDFWASWCTPCLRSFPWMNTMQQRYGEDGLVIIAVNLDSDRSEADAFLTEHPVSFDVVFDQGTELAKKYDVAAMPTSFIIDRSGQIVVKHHGFKVREQADYEDSLRDVLARNSFDIPDLEKKP